MTTGAFRLHAETLLELGYSPLPIIPRTKKPALKKWSDFCAKPMTLRGVRSYGTRYPSLGLAVALGYGGVIAVDIDTEQPDQVDAICSVLPPATVAKAGAKGFTAFYRTAPDAAVSSRHFASARKAGIADLLSWGTGTVLPPSLHPAGPAYRWLTPATLFDAPAAELPEVPEDIALRIAFALQPWMPKREYQPVQAKRFTAPGTAELRRITAFARAGLDRRVRELAETPEGGRNNGLFALAAGFGRYVHHGVLAEAELKDQAIAACQANGLLQEDGHLSVLATIHKGLARSENDELPVLKDRRPA